MKTYDLPGVFCEDMILSQAQLIKEIDPIRHDMYTMWFKQLRQDWREPVEDMIINLIPYVWNRYDAGYECVEEKKNGRYITDIDIDIETYAICFFKDLFKKDIDKFEFVSRELGKKSSSSDYYICIDPVNGTENMMNSCRGEYETSIAIVDHGEVTVSIIINPRRALVTVKGSRTTLIRRKPMLIVATAPWCHPQTCRTVSTNRVDKLKNDVPVSNIRLTGSPTCDLLNCIFGRTRTSKQYQLYEWEFRACQLIAEEYDVDMTIKPNGKKTYDVTVSW